jgi:hypothetical protein
MPDQTESTLPEDEKTITPVMEVHHHGHVHNDKKWKEYLFQFFMLFLAVFCGMLAEYQLEHIVEHNREEQYVQSFMQNIKEDTTMLAIVIKLGKEKESGIDSLLAITKTHMDTDSSMKKFYKWSYKTLATIPTFNSNDATSSQLRNSGGYRLIRKRGVADSLTGYDQMNKFLIIQGGYYTSYYNQANALWQEMIDLSVMRDTSYIKKGAFTDKLLPMISIEPRQKLLFNNKMVFYEGVLKNYNRVLQTMLDYATRLLVFLERKYDIKDND